MDFIFLRKYKYENIDFVYFDFDGTINCISVIHNNDMSEFEVIETAKSSLIENISREVNSEISVHEKLREEYIKQGVASDSVIEPLFEAFMLLCKQYELHYDKLETISALREEIKRNIFNKPLQ